MKRHYRVAIIGAGQIAAGYDTPCDTHILTHAHAISTHPRLKLLGFYDKDPIRSQAAALKWGAQPYGALDALHRDQPDAVFVCVPDEHHASVLQNLSSEKIQIVICEKPLTTSFGRSLELFQLYEERGTALAVNYQRRYDDTIAALRESFLAGDLGDFVCGSLLYSKGILHNGSHAVDLFRYLFGEPLSGLVTRRVFDYKDADPTVSGVLRFHCGEISLIAANERCFSIFEIDLIFQQRRFRFHQSGLSLEIYENTDDPIFPGYRELSLRSSGDSGLSKALALLTDELVAYLDSHHPMRIDVRNVLNTQKVCEELAKMPCDNYQSFELPDS